MARDDGTIPASLRHELVKELRAAQEAVGTAVDATERRIARRRVQDAKVALGEDGAGSADALPVALQPRVRAAMRALLHSRREGATICPSEPARIAGGLSWRRLMPTVREQAVRMSRDGSLVIFRDKKRAEGDLTTGVLRYGRAVADGSDS